MKRHVTKWLILRYLALSLYAQKRALRLARKHTGIASSTEYMRHLQRLLEPTMIYPTNQSA